MPSDIRLNPGRARARGLPTRGTTAPDRLRRVDRWIAHIAGSPLRTAAAPLVVDLGYGDSAVTTIQLARALTAIRPGIEIVGIENDRSRVSSAQAEAADDPTSLVSFRYGGFDIAGLRPTAIRAMNVLRQYDEAAVGPAWETLTASLAPGGILVEGTCDEIGRRGSWVTLQRSGPVTLTLSAHLPSLSNPSEIAPRLPKALIHRNVPGERIHALLAAADDAWLRAAPQVVFGPRQRWATMCLQLADSGWPVQDGLRRWRLGELSVDWTAIAPDAGSNLR